DTILKLKNNAVYIRNHRGMTHSIPAAIMRGILISFLIFLFVPEVNYLHLWLWTFFAVAFHVFVDIFNAYGTQSIRPFSHKCFALVFLNTFGSYSFFLHVAVIIALILCAERGTTFLVIYGIIALYYVKRYFDKREIVKKI